MAERIAAVIVTYNRSQLLVRTIPGLLAQSRPLDKIIIIDNASSDDTPDRLRAAGFLANAKIEYIRLADNTGGAGGFYEGVKRGYEAGFDWLWLMDDDVLPHSDCLERLLTCEPGGHEPRILCPNRYESTENECLENEPVRLDYSSFFGNHIPLRVKDTRAAGNRGDAILIEGFTFEGPLIHRDIVREIGFPNPEYFILGDDTDYSLRCQGKFRAYLVFGAKMQRLLPAQESDRVTWKDYYYVRNNITLMSLRYGSGLSRFVRPAVRTAAFARGRKFLGKVGRESQAMRTVLRGLLHGYLGLTGKRH